jgi:molybdate transport system substrate-binding protein
MLRIALCFILGLVATAGGSASAQPKPPVLTVYGAADLSFAFREIAPLFEKATGTKVVLVLGSTGTLAKQIEHGAPADVFFAANTSFVDDLTAKGAVIPETRLLYAQGRIVLAAPRGSKLRVERLEDLVGPGVKRVAIANPDHAPYGRAARQALQAARVWDALRPRLVYGENIRHTLQFIETGAVDAGIIALSIAEAPGVRAAPIDPALYAPLDQIAAVVKRSGRPELAMAFVQFVNGPEGRPIMKRYGFLLPGDF